MSSTLDARSPYVPVEAWVRPHLKESLDRCRVLGLDPSAAVCPRVAKNVRDATLRRLPSSAKYNYGALPGFFTRINQAMAGLGAVLLSTDRRLEVFNYGGDAQVVAALREKNIGVGSCLAENQVGTNALCLANKLGRGVWLDGKDHYNRIFEDYICYAQMDAPDINNLSFGHLLIVPRQRYFEGLPKLIEYVFFSTKAIFGMGITPTAMQTQEFINSYMARNRSSYIILDQQNTITNMDPNMLQTLRMDPQYVVGQRVDTLFPELGPLLPRISNRENLDLESILVNHGKMKGQSLLVSSFPMGPDSDHSTALIFRSKVYAAREAQTLTSGGAFFTLDDLIGQAPVFLKFKESVQKAAQSAGNVLITGESGSGKELVAHSIHNAGPRRGKAFITLNCAAIPKELISSELFGYAEGAFTGAKRGGSVGKFELANHGTLFLDEIGSMPLDMQGVLLRILEDHMVIRLGTTKAHRVDVRIIAATNQNLLKASAEGQFRADLFYRLSTIQIKTVPLREHIEDVPLITAAILDKLSQSYQKAGLHPSDGLLKMLAQYHWPGNVRELRNVLESLVVVSEGNELTQENLPEYVLHASNGVSSPRWKSGAPLPQSPDKYQDIERAWILELMQKHHGNKTMVAKEMGITRQTLYSRLLKYHL